MPHGNINYHKGGTVFTENSLEHILGQVSKVKILRFLIRTDLELSGREIAKDTGLSHVKVHTALKELNHYNIVEMRQAGKSILYRINLENVMVRKILIPLFENESVLRNILAQKISQYLKKPSPKSIILFGSVALGKARPDSDIDILVIASDRKQIPHFDECLKKAEVDITIGFGNHLAPVVMDKLEFKKRFKNKDKFIFNILREGKVIFGESVNDLIKHD